MTSLGPFKRAIPEPTTELDFSTINASSTTNSSTLRLRRELPFDFSAYLALAHNGVFHFPVEGVTFDISSLSFTQQANLSWLGLGFVNGIECRCTFYRVIQNPGQLVDIRMSEAMWWNTFLGSFNNSPVEYIE